MTGHYNTFLSLPLPLIDKTSAVMEDKKEDHQNCSVLYCADFLPIIDIMMRGTDGQTDDRQNLSASPVMG